MYILKRKYLQWCLNNKPNLWITSEASLAELFTLPLTLDSSWLDDDDNPARFET